MAQFNALSPKILMRMIATPAAPRVLDVRLNEDVARIPYRIPTAQAVAHSEVADIATGYKGQHVILVCHQGLKLSHGAAALLRTHGARAEVLEGGAVAWAEADFPALPVDKIPEHAPGSLWVTKQRPKIDRIACPWLIRRFIDPAARFLFVPAKQVLDVADRFDAISFDVPQAIWGHNGEECTFDHLLKGFNLSTPPLQRMAQVIRGADTGVHALAPECAGLLAISVGLSRGHSDDLAQLETGLTLYDALYRWARDGQEERHAWPDQHQ